MFNFKGFSYPELLARSRSDLSRFLVHLTRDGTFEVYKPHKPDKYDNHYEFGDCEKFIATDSLKSILSTNSPKLLARSPLGYFKYDINIWSRKRGEVRPEWLQSVCFSETPIRELKSFWLTSHKRTAANQYQKIGLAFRSEFVRKNNGHPVFYFDSRRQEVVEAIQQLIHPQVVKSTSHILHLFESFGPKKYGGSNEIDFRWEREWRIKGDFEFSLEDVAFGLCTENNLDEYNQLSQGKFPFIDPGWEYKKLMEYLKSEGWNGKIL